MGIQPAAVIPRVTVDAYILTLETAATLALSGDVTSGHECLRLGLLAARETYAGEPWANEVEHMWQRALDNYAARWGAARG